jgi:hypothetical protein
MGYSRDPASLTIQRAPRWSGFWSDGLDEDWATDASCTAWGHAVSRVLQKSTVSALLMMILSTLFFH